MIVRKSRRDLKRNIYSFSLKNFKPFKELEKIEIKPLTVICGVNNCGKSSLIQALLLLKQSILITKPETSLSFMIRRRMRRLIDYKYTTALLFEGELCHLSDYENVLNKYTNEKEFELSFDVEGNKLSITLYNPLNENIFEAFVKKIELKGKNYDLNLVANLDKDNLITDYSFVINLLSFYDFIDHCPLLYLQLKRRPTKKELSKLFIVDYEIKNVQVNFNGFIPERIILGMNDYYHNVENIFNKFSENNREFSKIYSEFKKDYKYLLKWQLEKKKKEDEKGYFEPFLEFFEYRERFIYEKLLSTIHYIGPLRDEPHRYYQFFDIRNLNIGNKGEYAPQILTFQLSNKIPPFKIFNIKDNKIDFNNYKKPAINLKKGLSVWSEILELPEINPEIVEKILFKIMVKLPYIEKKVTLLDVGFGISQILPVIIESLRMEKNHTLILEQPEIHLHPSMQSKLADFLLSMTVSGKNFIIETHSEYMINRLCLRIAQDQTNKLNELISIVFIKPPRMDENNEFRGSEIISLRLSEFGEIKNWPVGFFDQYDYDKMLKAAIDKRLNKRKSDD